MLLSIIGMPGVGKTFWSQKLENLGFVRYGCDDIIAAKLEKELQDTGFETLSEVAEWMGQPYEDRYEQNSKRYLELEHETMREVLTLAKKNADKDIVIDTTGSVIYLAEDILRELSSIATIIHLETPHDVLEDMYNRFLLNPKPVIWGDHFIKFRGETNEEAIARQYADLLEFRSKEYKKHAHKTFDYYMLQDENFSEKHFIEHLQIV